MQPMNNLKKCNKKDNNEESFVDIKEKEYIPQKDNEI